MRRCVRFGAPVTLSFQILLQRHRLIVVLVLRAVQQRDRTGLGVSGDLVKQLLLGAQLNRVAAAEFDPARGVVGESLAKFVAGPHLAQP
jgi:hypothetical protein